MSWTHAICVDCWKLKNGEREPHRLKEHDAEICCYCGKLTRSGIYVRDDPKNPAHCDHGDADE